jgi:uncharacterized BrkB/YihY/UPF0761 family membrane protein
VNIIERTVRRLDEMQQQHAPTSLVFGVIKKFGDDNGGVLVSNLAYSAFLALFPLLLLLVTVFCEFSRVTFQRLSTARSSCALVIFERPLMLFLRASS